MFIYWEPIACMSCRVSLLVNCVFAFSFPPCILLYRPIIISWPRKNYSYRWDGMKKMRRSYRYWTMSLELVYVFLLLLLLFSFRPIVISWPRRKRKLLNWRLEAQDTSRWIHGQTTQVRTPHAPAAQDTILQVQSLQYCIVVWAWASPTLIVTHALGQYCMCMCVWLSSTCVCRFQDQYMFVHVQAHPEMLY